MKLETYNPLTVMSISSGISYAVKKGTVCQVAVKTENGTGTSKVLTAERDLKQVSLSNTMNDPAFFEMDSATSILKESKPLLFSSQMGNFGIAPSNARVSDMICRLEALGYNSSVAFILRRINDHYAIVGRAMFPDIYTQRGQLVKKKSEVDRVKLHLDIRTVQLLIESSLGASLYLTSSSYHPSLKLDAVNPICALIIEPRLKIYTRWTRKLPQKCEREVDKRQLVLQIFTIWSKIIEQFFRYAYK